MTPQQSSPSSQRLFANDIGPTEQIVALLSHQPTRSPLVDAHTTDGGDHHFVVRKTDLSTIDPNDLQTGLLIYRPTPSPLNVIELRSEPYKNEHGFTQIDVRYHAREYDSPTAPTRSYNGTVFYSDVIDSMTYLQKPTTQQTLQQATS